MKRMSLRLLVMLGIVVRMPESYRLQHVVLTGSL
jgi:hypothetical protein